MNRTHRAVRASFYLALALPLAALACGQSFTAGPGDGGEEGGIVFGDAGQGHDATSNVDGSADGAHDGGAGHDGRADGPSCPPGPTNCGSCGNDCTTLPHVVNPQCTSGGQCSFTCAPGWQNCTTNPGAGCGTDITKQGNCGACGVTCSGNTPVCGGAGCVSGCDAGQTLCNSSCSNTSTDISNCGMCGIVCPTNVPHAQPACSGGMCGFSCLTNYMQCGQTCVPATPLNGVTVASMGDMTTNCGAPALPCGTITLAIAKAQQLGVSDIFVAQGTYQDKVNLANGIQVHGGWVYSGAGVWSYPSCSPNPLATVIQPLPGQDRVVVADYLGSASLDSLEIDNNTTAAAGTATQPGQTLYGIFASNAQSGQTSLSLKNVAISVADGGPGGIGTVGLPGNGPDAGCSADLTPNAGASGTAGTPGPGATGSGKYGPSGYLAQGGGTGLTPGGDGYNGKAAAPQGQCQAVYPGSGTNNPNCCDNGSGAGCITCSGSLTSPGVCGGQGGPGCASGGSQPGHGGTGGGASIGIFTYNAAVTLSSVSITTGAGGNGENGGLGGNVPAPLPPTTGASAKYVATCHNNCNPVLMTCVCAPSTQGTVLGSTGGTAGSGGVGGQGGGAAGGDSVCFAIWGTGSVTPTSGLTCNHGTGGLGGNPGQSNAGAPGLSAANN